MESDVSESSGEEAPAQYESEQYEDRLHTSRDSHETEEHKQEFDERNENLEARVQKHSNEHKSTLERKLSQKSAKGGDSYREVKDGGVTIIYYEYPDGRIKVKFEEKPEGYKYKQAVGKLALYGGEMESYDLSSKHTVAREISEEFYDKDVIRILTDALEEDDKPYYVKTGYDANGKEFKTYIHSIKLKSEEDWEKVEKASSKEGYARVLPLDEILSKGNGEYAFDYGKVIKKFFRERHPTQYRLALSGTYSMPIVSTSPSHVQTIDAFVNNLLAQSYSFPTISTNYKPLQNMGTSQFSLN